jgi:Uma2 family endonuclease
VDKRLRPKTSRCFPKNIEELREYWLVDPRTRPVEVYALSESGAYEMAGQYTGDDTVKSIVLADLALPVGSLFVN